MSYKHILATINTFILASLVSAQVEYTVDGNVFLDGQETHEGVQVTFYNIPAMDEEGSTSSDSSGYYNFDISPGYYVVEWTKEGYVPFEVGGYALAGDSTMVDVTLIPGSVLEVSGDVSGTWGPNYVYYVMGDITIPEGESLTIEPGVRVKFDTGVSMICNGQLIANGTEDARISFSSRQPTPLPGDWGNISLNAESNQLHFVDYQYASSGITGDNATGSTFDHIVVSDLLLSANGVYLENTAGVEFTNNNIFVQNGNYGLYLTGSGDNIVTDNFLSGATSRGIWVDQAQGSSGDFSRNSISNNGGDFSMYINFCDSCEISENVITGSAEWGIYTNNISQSNFSLNTVTGLRSGIHMYGSGVYGSNTFNQNSILEFNNSHNNSYGIYINQSDSNLVNFNELTTFNDNYDNMWGITAYGENNIIHDNSIDCVDCDDNIYAIETSNSIVFNNTIDLEAADYRVRGVVGSDNEIYNNYISIYGLENSAAVYGDNNEIYNNELINFRSPYYDNSVIRAGGDTKVYSNTIHSSSTYAVYNTSGQLDITDNTITATGSWGVYVNSSDVNIQNNQITCNDNCAYFTNASTGSLRNNTLFRNGQGGSGVIMENLSEVAVVNNIISNFETGVRAENDLINYNINNNNLWNISGSMFTGTALAPLIGQMIDENYNGDVSDIYENISFDPSFVDGSYQLSSGSACIDAGSSSYLDPNGTLSDIGAIPFGTLLSESNASGQVELTWVEDSSSDSTTTFEYYDLDMRFAYSDDEFIDLAETTENSWTEDGLMDSYLYEFRVMSAFSDSLGQISYGEASYSIVQVGIAEISLSTSEISAEAYEGSTATETITIGNLGGEDMLWSAELTGGPIGTLTFTKENDADYNDPENWDCITENVCLSRGDSQGLYNAATQGGWQGYTDGIEFAWGTTEEVLANGGIGQNGNGYTTNFQDWARMGPDNYDNQTYNWLSDNNPVIVSAHLIEEDLYIDMDWHGWASGCCGYFSYTRTDLASFVQFSSGSGSLAMDESEQITLSFEAGDLAPGEYDQVLTFKSNDPNQPAVDIPISFTVLGAANIVVSDEVGSDFGDVLIGNSSQLSVEIQNTGTADLDISSITCDNEAFELDTTAIYIPQGQIESLSVIFTPAVDGNQSANLTFYSNDPTDPEVVYTLTGNGLLPPIAHPSFVELMVSLDSDAVDSTQVLTISNTGQSDLNWEIEIDYPDDRQTVTFTKENYADYNNPENWDCITEDICITRQESQSIYNAAVQNCYGCESYDEDGNYMGDHGFNGLIEFAWGSTEQVMANGGVGIDGDGYTSNFRDIHRYGPYNDCCQSYYYMSDSNPVIVSAHLIEEDLYIDMDWHWWQQGENSRGGGGFSYTRDISGLQWLDVSESSGVTQGGGSSDINLFINPEDLYTGEYEATMSIISNDVDNPVISIPITLSYTGLNPPTVELDLSSISSVIELGVIDTQYVEITNSGDVELDWSLEFIENDDSREQTITFTKDNYADYNNPENWDCITENVCLSRRNQNGLYNAVTNGGWTGSTEGIEFAWGSTEQVMANGGVGLDGDGYTTNFQSWACYGPDNSDNGTYYWLSDNTSTIVSAHLIEEDLYIDMDWHWWQCCGDGGGFSYTRTIPRSWISISESSGTILPGESSTVEVILNGEEMGFFSGMIEITNEYDDSVNELDVALIVESTIEPGDVTYFDPVEPTESSYNIYLSSGTMDGQILESGDEIAILDGDLVVGASIFLGEFPIAIEVFQGDDENAGFINGNDMSFMLYDYGTSLEASAVVDFVVGDGTFGSEDYSIISLDATIYHPRNISIQGSRVELVSLNVFPDIPNAESVFGNLGTLDIVYTDMGLTYIPEYNVNTIGTVDLTDGYHVFVQDDESISYVGLPQDNTDWPVIIEPNRFNSIGYLLNYENDVVEVFSDIVDQIDIVQNDDGLVYIPSLDINTLGTMTPGTGYQVFLSSDQSATLIYESDENYSRESSDYVDLYTQSDLYDVTETGLPYTIIIEEAIIDEGQTSLKEGDQVNLFANNTCVGGAIFNGEFPFVVTAWGAYEEGHLAGFNNGDPIEARIYLDDEDLEITTRLYSTTNMPALYGQEAFASVSLNASSGLVPVSFYLEQNYPNPFNPSTEIGYQVPENSYVQLDVINLQGQTVTTLVNNYQNTGYHSVVWDGKDQNRKQLPSGVYFYTIEVTTDRNVKYQMTHKMLLIK